MMIPMLMYVCFKVLPVSMGHTQAGDQHLEISFLSVQPAFRLKDKAQSGC